MKRRLLLSGLILLGLAMVGPRLDMECGNASARLEPARIVVRADEALAPVSPLLFGQNFGPWMNTTDGYVADGYVADGYVADGYVADYRDAGVTLLRFPAGNWGDENDLLPNNLDDLAALADALDAVVSVQARSWRKGTPEKAAELVRYFNVEHDYGFRYWEVGNEPDLYARRPSRSGDPDFTVEWYNAQFRTFATAMKAVDPDIQVVGPVVTGGWREWMPAIIVVNKDPLQPREATLTLEGFRPAGEARVWLQDAEHLGVELPTIAVAGTFPYTYPPYSVTLLVLEPAWWSGWRLWAGLGLAIVALAVLAGLGRRVWRSR